MQRLPYDIKIKFFRLLNCEESISEFEQWVYATDTIEEILGEDYFNLISLDFSKRGSRYELINILERYIDGGEYVTWKLKKLLSLFLRREGNLPLMLCEFYELYCDGFYFLDMLGLGYGLTMKVPAHGHSSEYWQNLTDEEKKGLLSSILPGATDEAQKVLSWLNEGKIVITDEQDELGHYLYIDKRTEKEKNPNWKRVQKLSNNSRARVWWQLWH